MSWFDWGYSPSGEAGAVVGETDIAPLSVLAVAEAPWPLQAWVATAEEFDSSELQKAVALEVLAKAPSPVVEEVTGARSASVGSVGEGASVVDFERAVPSQRPLEVLLRGRK